MKKMLIILLGNLLLNTGNACVVLTGYVGSILPNPFPNPINRTHWFFYRDSLDGFSRENLFILTQGSTPFDMTPNAPTVLYSVDINKNISSRYFGMQGYNPTTQADVEDAIQTTGAAVVPSNICQEQLNVFYANGGQLPF